MYMHREAREPSPSISVWESGGICTNWVFGVSWFIEKAR